MRHSACDIAPGHCYGRLDVDLSPEGHAALPALRAALRASGITHIFSSPARRCRRLADQLSPDPVIDPRLQELDFGAWEGLPWDDVPRDRLDAWATDPLGFAPPGGETGATLIARVRAAAMALDQDSIVITHGGPLRLLPALLRGEPLNLLAPTPPLGAILHVQANAVSPAHSAATAHPPRTSPVNPPI